MYKRKTEARSRNHICREREINIPHSQYVLVAFVIRHAKRIRRIIFTCGLSGSNKTFHIIS